MMAKTCFECDAPAEHDHHIIPKSLGGTRTIPLCVACHSKVHGRSLTHNALVRQGQARARAEGKTWGGSAKGRRLSVTEEIVVRVRILKAEGKGVTWIAREAGITRASVYRVLGEAG